MKLKWFSLFFIKLPFILFVLLFSIVTINYLPAPAMQGNVFGQYFNSHLTYIALPIMLYCLFLTFFIVSGVQIAERYNRPDQKHFGRTVKYSLALAVIAAVSFPVSFAVTYLYAFGHINYHILAYNTGITEKAFLTSPQAIADTIADADHLTITPISEKTYKKELLLLFMKKKDGFYEDRILTSFPNLLYKRSYLPYSSVVMVRDYLAISNISNRDLSIISPALGKMVIENGLNKSVIKPLPIIEVVGKYEYTAYRRKVIYDQVKKIDSVIYKVDDSIASVSGFIAANENSIEKNQLQKEQALEKLATTKCSSAANCEKLKKKFERVMKLADDNIAKAQTALQKNQKVLGASVQNKNNLSTARDDIAATESYTDHELGVFLPSNKIKMTLDADSERVFDVYLSTLTHEYFHYLSYSGEENKLDHFFEEAITEYFSRKAAENYTGKTLDIGYPVGVRIIKEMTKKIPEKKLLEVYFSKDQKALTAMLNAVYGKNFYSQNAGAFSTLSYLPFEQSLELANLILIQMGSEQLTKDDFQRNINGLSISH